MIILHIGIHKTGTSSIQRYLGKNIDELKEKGFDFFRGMHRNSNNHTELHMATLRYDRDSFGRYGYSDIEFNSDYTQLVRHRVLDFIGNSKCPNQIFTNEGLSWIRYPEEMEVLTSMFAQGETQIILYLRDLEGFKASYKNQITQKLRKTFSCDKESVLNVEADSWVWDHNRIVDLFENTYGSENMKVIDYDHQFANDSDIIPSFLRALEIDLKVPDREEAIFLNRSVYPQSSLP